MKKIVALLENHVQWLLLGVAGLFVLLAVGGYPLGAPGSVEKARGRVGPGVRRRAGGAPPSADRVLHAPSTIPLAAGRSPSPARFARMGGNPCPAGVRSPPWVVGHESDDGGR